MNTTPRDALLSALCDSFAETMHAWCCGPDRCVCDEAAEDFRRCANVALLDYEVTER